MDGCNHEFQYYKSLNIYERSKTLMTFDSWRCRKCGLVRLYVRSPGKMVEDHFLEDPSNPRKRWIILVCKAGGVKVEAYNVGSGDLVEHRCSDGRKLKLRMGEKYEILEKVENHYVYEFDEVAEGFIDVSEDPPKAVALTKT